MNSGVTAPVEAPSTRGSRREDNKLRPEDRAAHDWYRFVLSYPAHLVRSYVDKLAIAPGQTVLDPFCGTGTTLVECKKLGIRSCGIEANPMPYFASRTKVDWQVDPDALVEHAQEVAEATLTKLARNGINDEADLPLFSPPPLQPEAALRTLPASAEALLLTNSISPLPLHKTLVLLDTIEEHAASHVIAHERLALAKALVGSISNLQFGPEIGVGLVKPDAPVVAPWMQGVRQIAADLRNLRTLAGVPASVHLADARELKDLLPPASVDAVITSPPYPNEKDYTRTTRLESVILGFITSKEDLRRLKQTLVRSNTRGVYKSDTDDRLVKERDEIQRIAEEIERRRISLGKTSGFERLYARVTQLYFGGMLRHLADLRTVLKPGAQLAYVVGDQASYLRVMIRTGQIIAETARSLGYEVLGIDLFRTRLATATKEQLREEVVILRWPASARVKPYPQSKEPSTSAFNDASDNMKSRASLNRYSAIIEKLFFAHYREGMKVVPFERDEIEGFARQLKIKLPKNLGDLIYSFRYRTALPQKIVSLAGPTEAWIIRPTGRSKYAFALVKNTPIDPNPQLSLTKIPDATPGIVAKYALSDEQALLAKVRYNRLVDVFTGVTCYSLQNHLRTAVAGMGQVETDEIYIGVDKKGAHYVFPVQAKGGKDKLSIVQLEQDFAVCAAKFPLLVCRSIAAQFMNDGVIALFEVEHGGEDGISISSEKHYKLVPPKEITDADIQSYRDRLGGQP